MTFNFWALHTHYPPQYMLIEWKVGKLTLKAYMKYHIFYQKKKVSYKLNVPLHTYLYLADHLRYYQTITIIQNFEKIKNGGLKLLVEFKNSFPRVSAVKKNQFSQS